MRDITKETSEQWEAIYDALDKFGVKYDTNYCDSETQAIIEFCTDTAGQDIPTEFDYDGTPEDFVKQFAERAGSYDVDEEVELFVGMRGKDGVPETVRELLDDCQEAKNTLMKISNSLKEACDNTDEYITEEMRDEIKEETENVLRTMCLGRNYREWSENTLNRICPYIENIIEDDLIGQEDEEDEEIGRLAVDEDMVVTAMMMYAAREE